MEDPTAEAHADAMRMDLRELVAALIEALGPTLVQAMTGTKDRGMPARWARADGPEPRARTQEQLRLGYRVWSMMRQAEGPRVASAWLSGSNSRLGELTPITAIRELQAAEVVGAAVAFIDDVHAA